MRPRLGALLTHPVQYYSPWFRELAKVSDLTVYYAHQQSPHEQTLSGFSSAFDWDVPLLEGYEWRWLNNVARRPNVRSFGGCDTPEIVDIVRRSRFDAFMVFGWNKKAFLQAAWGAHRSGTPLLVRLDSQLSTPREAWKKAVKWPAYSAVLPHLGHYLSPGRRTDEYLRHYSVRPDRIHRLAHMVDTERFSSASTEARRTGVARVLRAKHGGSDGDFVLLFVGKLIELKRTRLVLEALRELHRRDPENFTRIHFWIAGDGPLQADLMAFAGEHRLPVTFLGFVNQSTLPVVYAAADCLILPSAEETWGLVVNEAFACELPAIVTAVAGCVPELIEEGVTGWAFAGDDPRSLADIIAAASTGKSPLARARMRMLSKTGSYSMGVNRLLEILNTIHARRTGTLS